MQNDNELYDITIIGGGPAGLFTAFYGGLRNAKVKIIESLPELGGQLAALYPEKFIYDVAGFSKISAKDMVNQLKDQIKHFPISICLEQAVQNIVKLSDSTFQISTNKEIHYSKTVIIAAGNGAFKPKELEVDNAHQYEGKNLHYFIKEMEVFHDKNVLICGGGDSAVDWALMLEPIAKEVTLIHRREQFRAHEHSVEMLNNSSVKVKTPYIPSKLEGSLESIDKIIIQEAKGENTEILDVDHLIINYGFVSKLGPIKDWGLSIEKNSIVVNSKMETNIPGIYAAGDINTYPGKVKLIATGFGDAPTAVNNAMAYIDPSIKVQPKHSTAIFS